MYIIPTVPIRFFHQCFIMFHNNTGNAFTISLIGNLSETQFPQHERKLLIKSGRDSLHCEAVKVIITVCCFNFFDVQQTNYSQLQDTHIHVPETDNTRDRQAFLFFRGGGGSTAQ